MSERFWSKVDRAEGEACWNWRAYRQLHPRGKGTTYGLFWTGNKADGTGRMAFAHRVAWELENGPIPVGVKVLHRCDNPACVRPSHLFLGTQADNMDDMFAKGRGVRAQGSAHHRAKLTDDAVREIRRLHAGGVARRTLAERFSVSRSTISDVVSRTWACVA